MNIERMQQAGSYLASLIDALTTRNQAPCLDLRKLKMVQETTNELWVELNRERAKCARLNRLMDNMHELFGPEEDASESQSSVESTQEPHGDALLTPEQRADVITAANATPDVVRSQGVEPSNGPGVLARSAEELTGSARFARDGKEAQ